MSNHVPEGEPVDTLKLRFVGENPDGEPLHELRASHVAQVLQGLVGLVTDFDKAGVFHADGPGSQILVRPAREGSFEIEIVRLASEYGHTVALGAGAAGVPSISTVLWWVTRSARAEIQDFEHLENGNVKVKWTDDTAEEIPLAAWDELRKRKPQKKKQLRQIMAPLADERVDALEVSKEDDEEAETALEEPEMVGFTLREGDYRAMQPEDEIEEGVRVFNTEAQMSAIDFDDPSKWRVKTKESKRSATVEDQKFLARVSGGLAISKDDIFWLKIREESVRKNGRLRRTWTVLEVQGYRKASKDGGS